MKAAHKPALDICARAEERVREAQRLLIHSRPEALERAVAELAEVVGALREIGAVRPLDPRLRAPLENLRSMTRTLARQIDHASNLYMGFVQLRLANGYTRQGLPFVQSGSRNSVEA